MKCALSRCTRRNADFVSDVGLKHLGIVDRENRLVFLTDQDDALALFDALAGAVGIGGGECSDGGASACASGVGNPSDVGLIGGEGGSGQENEQQE